MVLSAAMMVGFVSADGALKRGDEGKQVEELQKLLKKHSCYDYGTITGYFGVSTENGVRKFQSTHGLDADGIAGKATMNKLEASADKKTTNPDSLSQGMSGDDVSEIQKRLKELGLYTEPKITGYYGPKTEEAVKLFQQASGMKADGIVGPKTKTAMFQSFNNTTLAAGMQGDDVKKLQKRLKDLGYFDGTATGLYGQLTEQAVTYYQKLNKLESDGVAGKKTQTSIYSKSAKKEKDARRAATSSSSSSKSSSSSSSSDKKADTDKSDYKDTAEQSAKGQAKGQEIVDYAKKFLGIPYVYGGDGPNSFDCTGLTCYVYKHYGVSLPRTAQAQGYNDDGVKITAPKKLMPGDLVFFNSLRDSDLSDHAGIYIGDGKFIHAPSTGSVVKITTLSSRRDFSWGRRVFK